jgi:aldose 1-epimerase
MAGADSMAADLLTLSNDLQCLQVAPACGAAIARWEWNTALGTVPLLKAADAPDKDPFELGGFALVPWSNRITQGGFAHQGNHHALAENRAGEAYPIHGDGWMQAWSVVSHNAVEAVLGLHSRRHHGNPYEYDAEQRIQLIEDGFRLTLKASHRGRVALPYGLGFSFSFPFDEDSRLQAAASGVWLSGPDPIPIAHSNSIPPGWDFGQPAPLAAGPALDNCFSGWDGEMRLSWPRQQLILVLRVKENSGFYVLQRSAGSMHFRFQPVTHPIDAFHAKARPGLVSLAHGESVQMEVELRVEKTEGAVSATELS